MPELTADASGIQVEIDASIVPRIARQGEETIGAFQDYVARLRTTGRTIEQSADSLDGKLEVAPLTAGAAVLTFWLSETVAYVWDVVMPDVAQKARSSLECSVDPHTGNLRVSEFELDLGETGNGKSSVAGVALQRLTKADLRKLGAPDEIIPRLMAAATPRGIEALKDSLSSHGPLLLACRLRMQGFSIERALTAMQKVAGEAHTSSDHASALLRSVKNGRLRTLASETQLAEALAKPWAHWKTYLHGQQHKVAYQKTYQGPVKVLGGPGTGKTIVAVHRVRCLLQQQGDLLPDHRPILLTSYVRSTVHQLQQLADALLGRRARHRVQVVGIDSLASKLLRHRPSVQKEFVLCREGALKELFGHALDYTGLELAPSEAISLWENVVLATDSKPWTKIQGFRQAIRLGQRMNADGYGALLRACRRVENELLAAHQTTHLLLLRDLLGQLGVREHLYNHAVVDEAQDLHPLHWRLLRRIVPEQPNDLFLVGDAGQRLYRTAYALSQCGIDTGRRGRLLTCSYRTSAEIIAFANALVGEQAGDDMEADTAIERRTTSVFSGSWPRCIAFRDPAHELGAAAAFLREWRREGMSWGEMMLVAPTRALCNDALRQLDRAGIPGRLLDRTTVSTDNAVSVVTQHRAKGLEARAVIVVGASDRAGGWPGSATQSPVQQEREAADARQLYVACTRARELLVVTWVGLPSPAVARALHRLGNIRVEINA